MGVYEKAYFEEYNALIQTFEDEKRSDTFSFLDIYLTTLVNTFKWVKSVPKIPQFMIERFLCSAGRVAFFIKDAVPMILPAFPTGALDIYGEYSEYYVVGRNGENFTLKKEEIELCYANSFALPYYWMAKHFADKTTEAMTAIDGALHRAGLGPFVVAATEAQKAQLVDAITKADPRKPYTVLPNGLFDPSKAIRLPVFDNKETDVIALWDVYTRYRNLYYSTIGINNIEIQKRERLTQAEGSGNDEIVRYSLLDDMYQCRDDWKKRVKEHFNYDIEFEVQRDAATVYNLKMSNADKIEYMKVEMSKGSNIAQTNNSNTEVDPNE